MTELIAASGMETAVAELAPADPGLTNALEGLKDALASLGRASARLRSRTTLSGFMYVLRKELSARRYSQDARSMAGVRIITGLELLSELFDTLFALGLSDSSSPAGFAPDIFFQGRDVGLPGRDVHDAREARRFLAALMCAGRVHLVHPETGKRGPVPESPYIRALRPFVDAGIVTRTGRWCRPSDPAQAVSAAGAMRGLAMRAALSGGPDRDALLRALGALPADTPGIARAKASLGRSAAPAPLAPPDRREFSVTELEEYLLCHYRYYQDRVAGSAPVEDPEDDIAPHRAGSAMHGILAEFYEKAKGPVTSDNAESELARLRAIAAERFRALPETAANWELARRFDEFLAPRFIITETKLAGSGYAPCLFEQTVRLEVTDEEHGSYAITGKVDRVELAADGGFVVVDYKTGKYPGPAEKLTELFQLPLYAHMLKESGAPLPGGRPGRPVGFVYYNLRDGSMRDVVLYEADAGVVGADPAKRGRKVAADTLDKRIEDAFNKAKEAVRDLLSGRFEPTCDKKQVCERCVYIDVCESPAGERDAEDNGGEVED